MNTVSLASHKIMFVKKKSRHHDLQTKYLQQSIIGQAKQTTLTSLYSRLYKLYYIKNDRNSEVSACPPLEAWLIHVNNWHGRIQ